MPYTSHGHHIPGSVKELPEPTMRMRCGATRLCQKCKGESDAFHALDPLDFQTKAKHMVISWLEENHISVDVYNEDDVYVSWFSKSLQNWKALLGTKRSDGLYFEVTYDGNFKRAYLDVYRKVENVVIHD